MTKNWAIILVGLVVVSAMFVGASVTLAQELLTVQYLRTLTLRSTPASVGEELDRNVPWLVSIAETSIREVPALDGRVIGTLSKGTEIAGVYYVVKETDEEWLEVRWNGKSGYISRMGLSRVSPENIKTLREVPNFPYGKESINRWWGIPLDYEPTDLVDIPAAYVTKVTLPPEGLKLRHDASVALSRMIDEMRKDGLTMYASSSYRSGALQLQMFYKNMRKDLSQRGTAPPGHSEHQLGTAVDLSSAYEARAALKKSDPQYAWLVKNAMRFGWRQSYEEATSDDTGYIEEPWHWRYFGPVGVTGARSDKNLIPSL